MSILDSLYALGDSQEVKLPSGKTAVIREMTGKEQRSFSDRAKMSTGQSIAELLAACVQVLDGEPLPAKDADRFTMVNNLLSADRSALAFYIRRLSLGDDFLFKAKCPNEECNLVSDFEVSLSDTQFPLVPYAQGDERHITYESTVLPGLRVRYTHLDGNAELKIIRNRAKLHALSDLEGRNPKAWDAEKEDWSPIQVDRLSDKLILEMRKHVRSTEGHIDTEVVVTCEHCGQEAKFNLITLPDFMIPSVTS